MDLSHCALAGLGLALSLACSQPIRAETVADAITVDSPYVRAVPPVVKTTAAFMQLTSDSDTEHFVVGASSPIAQTVELHMHTMDDGVMRMRRIVHIHLPPHKAVTLEPGGLHIMLFDLKQDLQPGANVPLTLEFDDGSSKTVEATVRHVGEMMHH